LTPPPVIASIRRIIAARRAFPHTPAMPETSFAPLTPDRLADAEAVIGGCGTAGKCWCSYWFRAAADARRDWGEPNRVWFRGLVRAGPPPGLLAYRDGAPAAWACVAPRGRLARLARSRRFKPLDAKPVWSVACFVTAKAHRRGGLMRALIAAAESHARAHGAPALEAYPFDRQPGTGSGDLYPGTLAAFLDAGFTEMARPLPRRAIVRKGLADGRH
jgi:GNAT superfamily N-acetyltransferase